MSEVELYALQRMSRTAADLGHYNLGKLLNAAAVSLANRALYAASLPTTDRALAEAVAASIGSASAPCPRGSPRLAGPSSNSRPA